ncbi:di-N-acetylchitobiase-like [Rhinoraja longicauda]
MPIGYASRSLNNGERNYSKLDKEGLAIVFGVKKFHTYLYGRRFVINTNHKLLLGLFCNDKAIRLMASPRVIRWSLTLAAYDYNIMYNRGQPTLTQTLLADSHEERREKFAKFMKANGIRHVKCVPYHPVTNGLAERAVQTVKAALCKMLGPLQTHVARFLISYPSTPQTSTTQTPAEMLMKRKIRTRFSIAVPDERATIELFNHPQSGSTIEPPLLTVRSPHVGFIETSCVEMIETPALGWIKTLSTAWSSRDGLFLLETAGFTVSKSTGLAVIIADNGGEEWKHYDWSKVTAIIFSGTVAPELVCHAHAHKARVILHEILSSKHVIKVNDQQRLITDQVRFVQQRFLDGLALSFDEIVAKGSVVYLKMPIFISNIVEYFQANIPGSQIMYIAPWSPNCIDNQCQDYAKIVRYCDALIVSSFDMQSHMWEDCRAKSGAPHHQTFNGIWSYIKLGIDSRKIVMAVPWYGLGYPCQRFIEAGNCELRKVSFRGSPCSDQVSWIVTYSEIMQALPKSASGRIWDDDVKAPYYVYQSGKKYHEVWYDDPESISLKSTFMKKLKLGGISVWFGNFLNYSSHALAVMQTAEMWNALCSH